MNTYETAGMNMACFESILKMTQGELKEYLAQQLREYGYEPVCKNGFLYAEGTVPVLLVAHLDTVHTHQPDIICRSEDGRYLMSPYGIGGDDRAGVYMILLLMRECRCHILFCEEEEIGGVGAKKFAKSKLRPEVNYIVELDRRSTNALNPFRMPVCSSLLSAEYDACFFTVSYIVNKASLYVRARL